MSAKCRPFCSDHFQNEWFWWLVITAVSNYVNKKGGGGAGTSEKTVILLWIPYMRLSARWATELLWQPPEEYICEIVEMLCVWKVSYLILLEIKLLQLRTLHMEVSYLMTYGRARHILVVPKQHWSLTDLYVFACIYRNGHTSHAFNENMTPHPMEYRR